MGENVRLAVQTVQNVSGGSFSPRRSTAPHRHERRLERTLRSITRAGAFTATGAIAISAGAFQLNGGTIRNTVINESGTGNLLIGAHGANLLNAVTVAGDLTLNTTLAQTRLVGGATFNTAHLARNQHPTSNTRVPGLDAVRGSAEH